MVNNAICEFNELALGFLFNLYHPGTSTRAGLYFWLIFCIDLIASTSEPLIVKLNKSIFGPYVNKRSFKVKFFLIFCFLIKFPLIYFSSVKSACRSTTSNCFFFYYHQSKH